MQIGKTFVEAQVMKYENFEEISKIKIQEIHYLKILIKKNNII